MVTTGRALIVYNGKTDTTMHLPMSASPVSFLLRERVDLHRSAEVRRVERRPRSYVLTVSKKGGGPATLRLVFRRKPFGLKNGRSSTPSARPCASCCSIRGSAIRSTR